MITFDVGVEFIWAGVYNTVTRVGFSNGNPTIGIVNSQGAGHVMDYSIVSLRKAEDLGVLQELLPEDEPTQDEIDRWESLAVEAEERKLERRY